MDTENNGMKESRERGQWGKRNTSVIFSTIKINLKRTVNEQKKVFFFFETK